MTEPNWACKLIEWKREYQALLDGPYRTRLDRCFLVCKVSDMGGTAGRYTAPMPYQHATHMIEISPLLQEAEAKETLGHELAHMLVFVCFGEMGHTKAWTRFMLILNLRPDAFHSIPLTGRRAICAVRDRLDRLVLPVEAEAEAEEEAGGIDLDLDIGQDGDPDFEDDKS